MKLTLKTIAVIAALGDLLGNTIQERNKWKEVVLSELGGLTIPEGWAFFTDLDKEERLNMAIKIFSHSLN